MRRRAFQAYHSLNLQLCHECRKQVHAHRGGGEPFYRETHPELRIYCSVGCLRSSGTPAQHATSEAIRRLRGRLQVLCQIPPEDGHPVLARAIATATASASRRAAGLFPTLPKMVLDSVVAPMLSERDLFSLRSTCCWLLHGLRFASLRFRLLKELRYVYAPAISYGFILNKCVYSKSKLQGADRTLYRVLSSIPGATVSLTVRVLLQETQPFMKPSRYNVALDQKAVDDGARLMPGVVWINSLRSLNARNWAGYAGRAVTLGTTKCFDVSVLLLQLPALSEHLASDHLHNAIP